MPALNPYLSFRTEARQAMEFYQSVLGGDLDLSVFGDFPDMVQDPSQNELIMHAQLNTPDGLVLMASDTPDGMTYEKPQGISVSLSGNTQARTQEVWDRLSEGATITMPLDTPPWGGTFGMLVDRFGIAWMLHGDPE
ncbi:MULTISPECIES: VOC family protein [unclassified Microbacterium]|uniref:VOC family protein n=1 Tax=unclassified Microbacterium TaxID=2609290 RepID=UPI0016050A5D|nr:MULTISPECIES: VOC family protein [unclassified Microbacterium]QNA91884.1 VOC family protein [Microbacterium sp. Se63.02b]QYM65104.1 VOC family protein [Microbacterium sp. Se5.02b]